MVSTRSEVLALVRVTGFDEWAEEDADLLVAVLEESYSAFEIKTWLFMYDAELDGTPLILVENGRGREVMKRARHLVGMVTS